MTTSDVDWHGSECTFIEIVGDVIDQCSLLPRSYDGLRRARGRVGSGTPFRR
jgi:hypothetical protein